MFSKLCNFLLLFNLIILSNGKSIHTFVPGGRIVGGNPANISSFPYQVSVLYDGAHACGGSIITTSYILTAAHCTYEITANHLSIRAGSSYHNSGGTVVKVSKIYQHSQFNIDTYDYDVSVLKLASTLTVGTNIATIGMVAANTAIKNGDLAVATGWGRLTNDGVIPNQLQTVSLPTIATTNCQAYYGTGTGGITDRMFCAGYDSGGKDTCQGLSEQDGEVNLNSGVIPETIPVSTKPIEGNVLKYVADYVGDSGGPLALSGILIGITSWGDVCGQAKSPGVYTKLALFRTYVDGIIKQ